MQIGGYPKPLLAVHNTISQPPPQLIHLNQNHLKLQYSQGGLRTRGKLVGLRLVFGDKVKEKSKRSKKVYISKVGFLPTSG